MANNLRANWYVFIFILKCLRVNWPSSLSDHIYMFNSEVTKSLCCTVTLFCTEKAECIIFVTSNVRPRHKHPVSHPCLLTSCSPLPFLLFK